MRLIEIRADQTVIIDGLCLKIDVPLKKTISAVFWDESVKSGFVEMKKGKGRVINSMDEFSDIITAFQEKKMNAKETSYSLRILPADNLVSIDGVGFEFDFEIDPNYYAVHWDGKSGFIETRNGLNITLTNIDEFSDIIKAHEDLLLEQEAEEAKRKEEFEKPENVAKRKIIALEQEITPRRLREAMLTQDGKDWLAAKEAEIEKLRSKI